MSKPRTPTRWVNVVTTRIKDPRIDSTKLAHGQTHLEIVVADMLDTLGRHWRRYGEEEPVMLGGVPDVTGENARLDDKNQR